MEYCPTCLSNTLTISGSGIVQILINDKPKDNARVLFNVNKNDQFEADLEDRLEDFLKWLSDFKNLDAEKRVQLVSGDFSCAEGCIIPMNIKFSIVGLLITKTRLEAMYKRLSEKFSMTVITQSS